MSFSGGDRVVLLHGLAETPMIMGLLEMSLRQAGYEVSNISYPSTLKSAADLTREHILPLLSAFGDAGRLHFVTHSLGGVLLHACLQDHRPSNLGRVVMTSPGLHGSEALEIYRRNWVFRMMYGPAAYQSGTGADGFAQTLEPAAAYELGVVAGCLSSDPVANLFIPMPHDGKISVGRTKLAGMKDHIVLPLPHDLTSSDPLAIAQIKHFLMKGSFFHVLSRADLSAAIAA